jgi:hypothetical protein
MPTSNGVGYLGPMDPSTAHNISTSASAPPTSPDADKFQPQRPMQTNGRLRLSRCSITVTHADLEWCRLFRVHGPLNSPQHFHFRFRSADVTRRRQVPASTPHANQWEIEAKSLLDNRHTCRHRMVSAQPTTFPLPLPLRRPHPTPTVSRLNGHAGEIVTIDLIFSRPFGIGYVHG